MHFKNFFTGIILALAFIAFTPNGVSAQMCEDIGATCRPGWISGCGAGENPIFSHFCPPHTSGSLICCQMAQSVNDCTNAGGLCRSDLYTSFPGEPACGYNYDIQSPESCGQPAQICCLPPPNIGASCSGGNGTCQLPAACVGGGAADAACFGGAVCCQPILDFFNVPANCSIPTGGSNCSITISWSISNPLSPSITNDGSSVSGAASSPGTVVVLSHGLNVFELSDGPLYSMQLSSAQCVGSDVWDGSKCAPPVPIIGSVCRSADSGNMGTCDFACAPPLATETVDPTYVPATCGGGSTYCCVSYGPPGSPTLTVPLGCDIPVGLSFCDITVSWDIPSPVNPQVSANGTLFSTDASSPGFSVVADYGTVLIQLWNNGAVIKSASSDARCIAGSSWDVATGVCVAAPAACTGACVPVGFGCTAPDVPDPTGTCNAGQMCCTSGGPGPGPAACTGACVPVGFGCTAPDVPDPTGTCNAGQMCCTSGGPGPGPAACTGACVPVGFGCTAPDVPDPTGTCNAGQMCCTSGGPGPGPGPGPAPAPITVKYPNPLFTGDLSELIAKFLIELQKLIAILAIIFIVIGAFLYITSAGDTGRVELAKKCILGALIGLALGIAAPMFFREIGTMLGILAPVVPAGPSLLDMTMGVVNFILSVIGVIALIMLVVGAFMYLTAAGDEGRIDTGKNIVKYSIIGIAVSLASIVLIRLVVGFF